jgi:hypothetical protein
MRAAFSRCKYAQLPAALRAAEAKGASSFAWLPEIMTSGRAAAECARARQDLARVDAGLCTRWPLVDQTCQCGAERYSYDRCKAPRCLYEPGKPDLFDCPGDPVDVSRTNF